METYLIYCCVFMLKTGISESQSIKNTQKRAFVIWDDKKSSIFARE